MIEHPFTEKGKGVNREGALAGGILLMQVKRMRFELFVLCKM